MSSLAEAQQRVRDAVVLGDPAAAAALIVGGQIPARRLAIHARHYATSLMAAVMGRFPATGWLVGTPALEEAAMAFVRHHPPSAPCIAEYGQRFPGFLAERPGAARVPYVREFADLDWQLGRLAVAIDVPAITRSHCAAVPPDQLADAVIGIQPGTYYGRASWPIDELMALYLSDAAPDQLALATCDACIEVRGARGSFRFLRLAPEDFAFRHALHLGLPAGKAAERAWAEDQAFDPGAALVALVDAGLATSVNGRPERSRR